MENRTILKIETTPLDNWAQFKQAHNHTPVRFLTAFTKLPFHKRGYSKIVHLASNPNLQSNNNRRFNRKRKKRRKNLITKKKLRRDDSVMPHLLLNQTHLHQTPFIFHHSHNHPHFFQRCLVSPKHSVPPMSVGVLRRPQGNGTIRCMANQRRVKMVAKQIQRELSDMLLTDKVLQYAVLPEAALGADRYLSSLTTISDVEVSADLQAIVDNFVLIAINTYLIAITHT